MSSLTLRYYSQALGMNTAVSLVFPEENTEAQMCLPLVYLLPDEGEDHTRWIRETGIERLSQKYKFAAVMPGCAQGCYTNMKLGYHFYDAWAEELPQIVHTYFPSISSRPNSTYLIGAGMGGYGAVKTMLKQAGKYAGVASFSGILDIKSYILNATASSSLDSERLLRVFGMPGKSFSDDDDLLELAVCLPSGFSEKFYFFSTEQEETAKIQNHLPPPLSAYLTLPGNGWEFWDHELEHALRLLLKGGN